MTDLPDPTTGPCRLPEPAVRSLAPDVRCVDRRGDAAARLHRHRRLRRHRRRIADLLVRPRRSPSACSASCSTGSTSRPAPPGPRRCCAPRCTGSASSRRSSSCMSSSRRAASATPTSACSTASIVALGTFTSGVHTNWRLVVIGAALGLGTAAVAYVERYLWVLFALAVLALAVDLSGRPLARPPTAAAPRCSAGGPIAGPAAGSEVVGRAEQRVEGLVAGLVLQRRWSRGPGR